MPSTTLGTSLSKACAHREPATEIPGQPLPMMLIAPARLETTRYPSIWNRTVSRPSADAEAPTQLGDAAVALQMGIDESLAPGHRSCALDLLPMYSDRTVS